MELFDLDEEEKEKITLYHWDSVVPNDKYKLLILWKDF